MREIGKILEGIALPSLFHLTTETATVVGTIKDAGMEEPISTLRGIPGSGCLPCRKQGVFLCLKYCDWSKPVCQHGRGNEWAGRNGLSGIRDTCYAAGLFPAVSSGYATRTGGDLRRLRTIKVPG